MGEGMSRAKWEKYCLMVRGEKEGEWIIIIKTAVGFTAVFE
jgi:hypothetical protein